MRRMAASCGDRGARAPGVFAGAGARGDGARRAGFARLGWRGGERGAGLIGGLIMAASSPRIASRTGCRSWRSTIGGARADRAAARSGRGRGDFPLLLLLVSGGHCLCAAVDGVGRHAHWAAPWTMLPARHSTRWRSCTGWAGRVGRRWSSWRSAAIRGGTRFAAEAGAGRVRLQFFGPEDRGGAGGGAAWGGSAAGADRSRHRGKLSARGGRGAGGPGGARDGMMRGRWRDAHVLVVAGGVAANGAIRAALAEAASEQGFVLVAPRCGCAPTTR